MPETHSAPARHLTAFLEKGEPFRERGPQHSVSTKGLEPCASQPEGPFSSKTALRPRPSGGDCYGELRRISIPRTPVNKPLVGIARVQAAISHDVRRRIHSPIITTPASASGITPQ